MQLSVIIVSYNVRAYLCQCLDSLRRALRGIDAEVLVVDNHSKDDTVAYLRSRYPEVRLTASNHNNGFAHGNNMAIRQAAGEYVLLLNPDTIVTEDALRSCMAFLDKHPEAGALGVRMMNTDGTDAPESRRGLPTPATAFYKMSGLCARHPKSRRMGRYYMGWLPWDEPARIDVVSGAFLMTRRTVLDRTGLLDEDYFMYGEDIDLSYRILKAGFTNWYCPARILHYKGESTQKSSFRYVHVFYQAMLIFFRKHYGHLSLLLGIPVKTAIYMKATAALTGMTVRNIRRALGLSKRKKPEEARYVVLAAAGNMEKCRALADRNSLTVVLYTADEASLPEGHIAVDVPTDGTDTVYAVYDTSAYSYRAILANFAKNPRKNVRLGTYDPEHDILITDRNVFE